MTNESRADDRSVLGAYDFGARRVALSDGRYAWEVPVSAAATLDEVVRAVAGHVLTRVGDMKTSVLTDLPATGSLNVLVQPHLGGASVRIHCRADGAASADVNAAGFALLCEAVVASVEAAPAEPGEADVPPRDAAERLTFASWAVVTGKAARGIFGTLPILDDESAQKLAARLTKRSGGEITVDDVRDAETIEQLAETVRRHLEDGLKIDSLVRTLRPRADGSDAVPVFVFHPAGGSTVVYEPLLERLPVHTPVFGLERVEGPLQKRAAEYLPVLREIQGDGPYVLAGWSFGGALAYAVAKQLRKDGADVRLVGLIDTVMPGETVEDTPDEIRSRWQRYAKFAKKTYGLDAPLPFDRLAAAGSDEEQIEILMDLLRMSGSNIPSGIIEHQRTSWLDNRAIPATDLETYDGDVVLYMAESYLDDQIALEPAFGVRRPDGGWGEAVANLAIVHVPCDHIQIVDEPYIGIVATDLSSRLASVGSQARSGQVDASADR